MNASARTNGQLSRFALAAMRVVAGATPRTKAWRILRAAVLGLIGAYALLCAHILVFERTYTFSPEPRYVTPSQAGLQNMSERVLTSPNGDRLVVWRATAQPGKPTVLYFHGNGENLGYRAGRVKTFQQNGYGIFMMAYPGYSGSTGIPTQATIVAHAGLAYDTLRAEKLAPRDIVIYGESLGTSVAVLTAVTHPSLAVILESPFTSMVAAWRQFVPFLPIGMLLRDRFDSLSAIPALKAPLLIMHGEKDGLVSIKLGRELFAAAPEPKRFVAFPGANHVNLYQHGAADSVRDFIEDVLAGKPI